MSALPDTAPPLGIADLLADGDAHVLDDWLRPLHLARYRELFELTPGGVLTASTVIPTRSWPVPL